MTTKRNPVAHAMLSKSGPKPKAIPGKKGRAPYARAGKRENVEALTETDPAQLIRYMSV